MPASLGRAAPVAEGAIGCTGVRMRRTCRRCCGCAAMRLERSTTLRACTTIPSLRTLSLTSCVSLRRRCGGPRHAATAAGWSSISRADLATMLPGAACYKSEPGAIRVRAGHRWCRRGDLNPQGPKSTWPSTMRVCLFRHADKVEGRSRSMPRRISPCRPGGVDRTAAGRRLWRAPDIAGISPWKHCSSPS